MRYTVSTGDSQFTDATLLQQQSRPLLKQPELFVFLGIEHTDDHPGLRVRENCSDDEMGIPIWSAEFVEELLLDLLGCGSA